MNDMNMAGELLLLSPSEWTRCATAEAIGPGRYAGWQERDCPFLIETDARPLAMLAESAARGYRVYEFMSLRRPAELLRYFSARMAHVHWRDFEREAPFDVSAMTVPPLRSMLPPALVDALRMLVSRADVHSVSCDLKDYPLWRLLVAEQVRRAEKTSLPPQSAFGLCGPEGWPPSFITAREWGGYVHHPYEGVVPCDIYFLPHWRYFDFADMQSTCKYLLTRRDFGERECALRSVFDGWFLYEYKGEYVGRNPFVQDE